MFNGVWPESEEKLQEEDARRMKLEEQAKEASEKAAEAEKVLKEAQAKKAELEAQAEALGGGLGQDAAEAPADAPCPHGRRPFPIHTASALAPHSHCSLPSAAPPPP